MSGKTGKCDYPLRSSSALQELNLYRQGMILLEEHLDKRDSYLSRSEDAWILYDANDQEFVRGVTLIGMVRKLAARAVHEGEAL